MPSRAAVEALSYLDEPAAEVATDGDHAGGAALDGAKAAQQRRQSLLMQIAQLVSKRAQAALKAVAIAIWMGLPGCRPRSAPGAHPFGLGPSSRVR